MAFCIYWYVRVIGRSGFWYFFRYLAMCIVFIIIPGGISMGSYDCMVFSAWAQGQDEVTVLQFMDEFKELGIITLSDGYSILKAIHAAGD